MDYAISGVLDSRVRWGGCVFMRLSGFEARNAGHGRKAPMGQ
jgi:hypothetical protein